MISKPLPFVLSPVKDSDRLFQQPAKAVFLSLFESKQYLRVLVVDLFFIRFRDVQLFHLF